MAYLLFTVQEISERGNVMTLGEGIRMSELSKHPNVKNFTQGIALELRHPDDTKQETFLLNYGIGVTSPNSEELIVEQDPYVRFIVSADSVDKAKIIGSEIWWLDEKIGKSREEINELLKEY